ncbi:MAG: TIGR01777 family oxidoreductase [Ferruginibacter sp.]
MQTVLITGGTGLIGRQLTKHLSAKGYQVIILTRKVPFLMAADPNVTFAIWDVATQTIDLVALQKADYLIHLAGAGVVDKKWTAAYKNEIIKSRTESSAFLIETLKKNPNKVKTLVSASAIGWYGEDPSPGKDGFVETDKPAPGFLGETCKLWEESIEPVEELGIRLVKIRTGIVLSNEGGALPEFKGPVKFGVAGILGSGKQVVSWIHIDDLCRMYIEAIENDQLFGSYNGVAPGPVTNKELTMGIANHLKGKFYIPMHVPEFVLKIMLGDRSMEVLKSTTVSCEKIKKKGFTFLYPSIESALLMLCKK